MNSDILSTGSWREGFFRTWFPIGLFSVVWLDLFRLLSGNWVTREQYAYGWFVPFFFIYFLWRRWMDRPEQSANSSIPASFLLRTFVVLAALLLLPMRIIYEVNRDWPFISWPYAIVVVVLSLYAFGLVDSPKRKCRGSECLISPWQKHFSFPVCLIFLAVVWPGVVENMVTQSLMRVVTAVTVGMTGWFGVPAVQQGNVIELSNGSVGIDEACSGVRSFHASLMVGVVMGELYRLRALPRIALVLAGLILAVVFNVARTTWLTVQTAREGAGGLAKWHDPAGWTTAMVCFIAVWGLAIIVKKRSTGIHSTSEGHKPENSGQSVAESGRTLGGLGRCRAYLLAVGAWCIVVLGLNEVWYRSHEKQHGEFARWTVVLSSGASGFHTIELSKRTRELLGYDSGVSAKWQESDGADWTVYFFQWDGKTAESIMRARSHRPEICLPATGIKQATDTQEDFFEITPLKLPFRHASYSAGGEMLYVFYCLWQDGDEARKGMRTRGRADRFLGPLAGQRRFGQKVLEIITSGYPSATEAESAVRKRLREIVQIEVPAGPEISALGN